ncbi:MAG: hypothetical protein LBI28_07190 [Treponema sp.]|jgi:hypothetical protein|nr:hypothetical protein [Treponema sp.]
MKLNIFMLIITLLSFSFIISCSSTPLPSGGSVKVPDDFLGFVHAGDSRTTEEYALLDDLGVDWILSTFYWRRIEAERGVFDFSSYDDYVNTANREGKKVIAVLAYETPWLFPSGERKKYISRENIPHYLNFVEQTVLHFKDRVDVWSIWNEPNIWFWSGPKNVFYDLSRAAAQRIREVAPASYIIGGAFFRVPKNFIIRMHRAGALENLDGIAFHPYALNPRGSMLLYDKFLNILSEINYTGDVWVTEIGYPSRGFYPSRVSLQELPSHVVKTITGAAARGARALLWYQLFDYRNPGEPGSNSLNSEDFFGLAYPNLTLKSGGFAYALCSRYLSGARYANELPIRENIPANIVSFCFLESSSGYNTLVLWNDQNKTQTVNLELSSQAEIHNISTGENRPLPENISVSIGKQPLIITWQGTALPRLYYGE